VPQLDQRGVLGQRSPILVDHCRLACQDL
jgi:hypothetical protein